MKICTLLSILCILSTKDLAFSQKNCYSYKQIVFNSQLLKENVNVGIYVPVSYNKNDKLKSIYVLDGYYLAPLVAANLETILDQNQSISCIVIAVTSSNRQRDFTPISDIASGQMIGSGGADTYLKYLENELIPIIENKFITDTNRIIIGHSLGGLLAYYSLVKNSTLFHTIISIDGSLWWNEGRTGQAVIEKLKNTPDFRGEIVECRKDITQPVQFKPNLELLKYLAFNRPPGLVYNYLEFNNVTHATVVYPGIYYGLQAVLCK